MSISTDVLEWPLVTLDDKGFILGLNQAAEETYGLSESDAVGKQWDEVVQTWYFSISELEVEEKLRLNGVWEGEVIQNTRLNERINVLLRVWYPKGVHFPESVPIKCLLSRKIDPRIREEEVWRKTTLFYGLLSEVDRILIKVRERETLIQRIRDLIARIPEFRHVWITGSIHALGEEDVSQCFESFKCDERCPISGEAGKKERMTKHFKLNPDLPYLIQRIPFVGQYEEAKSHCGSFACFPLTFLGKPAGFLSLTAWKTEYFDELTVSFFQRICSNISWAYDKIGQEEALAKLRQHLNQAHLVEKTIMDNLPNMIWMKDVEGKILFTNRAFNKFWNLDMKILKEKRESDVIPERTRLQLEHDEEKMRILKVPIESEEIVTNLNGKTIWMETIRIPLFEEGGEYSGMIGIGQDISEKKKGETIRYQQSEAIRCAYDGIALLDTNLHITFTNASFQRIYGHPEERGFAGIPFSQLIEPSAWKGTGNAAIIEMREKGVWQGEIEGLCSDRTSLSLEMTLSLINQDVFVCIIRDITEKKLMQEQLIRAAKLTAVGQLSSGVAHEFNNILAIIKTTAQLLMVQHRENMDLYGMLKTIDEETGRGSEIVSDILAFARSKDPKRESLSLSAVIEDALKIHRKAAALENILISTDYQADEMVFIDRNQVMQVLTNIIINARHAIRPKNSGSITVSLQKASKQMVVKIRDTGIGMDEFTRKRIFTPFFTTKSAFAKDSSNLKGTGLGLAISETIMLNHGGKIEVESEAGEGTVFSLFFPRILDQEKEASKTARREWDGFASEEIRKMSEVRVLLVDDEQSMIDPVRRMLQLAGVKICDVAYGSAVALEMVLQRDYDLVIADLLMPGMDGRKLLSEIRQLRPQIKVVFATGQASVESGQLLKEGAMSVIRKPFAVTEILELILDCAEKRVQS